MRSARTPWKSEKPTSTGDPQRRPHPHSPYHQEVEDNILPRLIGDLESSSDYQARREAVLQHNARSSIIKRGIALTTGQVRHFFYSHLVQSGPAP